MDTLAGCELSAEGHIFHWLVWRVLLFLPQKARGHFIPEVLKYDSDTIGSL